MVEAPLRCRRTTVRHRTTGHWLAMCNIVFARTATSPWDHESTNAAFHAIRKVSHADFRRCGARIRMRCPMAIVRVEEMISSVTDVEASAAFFTDAGLEPLASSDANRSFRTPANQYLRLHPAPSSGEAPGVEEIIWGVDDDAGLQAVHTELARDRTVERDAAGTLHTHDDGGYRIAFKVAAPTPLTAAQPPTNLLNDVRRRNRGVEPHGRPRPLRIIHVALDILKEARERANAFY